jgi:hypothetical protein
LPAGCCYLAEEATLGMQLLAGNVLVAVLVSMMVGDVLNDCRSGSCCCKRIALNKLQNQSIVCDGCKTKRFNLWSNLFKPEKQRSVICHYIFRYLISMKTLLLSDAFD